MFFRSLLLFSCHTSMQHGHSDSVGLAYTHRLSAHIDAFFLWYTQSSTHLHKSHTPTTQQSPLAPTHLMFSSYYVKMDTHNCAGTVCCFCWRLSAAPMSPQQRWSPLQAPQIYIAAFPNMLFLWGPALETEWSGFRGGKKKRVIWVIIQWL